MEQQRYDKDGVLIIHDLDNTPNPFLFSMHAHPVCELYYFMNGSGYYSVEGANYPLEKGSLLLMREGEFHALHIDPALCYERITVNFPYQAIDPDGTWQALHTLLYDREPGKQNMTRLGDSAPYVAMLYERLLEAVQEENEASFEVLTLLRAILAEIVRVRRRGTYGEELPENVGFSLRINDVRRTEAKVVLDIIGYINAHLFEIENLSEIENKFFFSRSYINRIFKAATGSSVWNYVLLKRLIAAQNMLKNGTPAAVAAAKCGFNDYSSFYKQYKNKLGVAPTNEKMV